MAGAVLVFRDITARRKTEREQALALEREQAARRELEAASRSKDEFVTTLSHELRTPLNAIFGWVQLLRAGALDETARAHALEVIERNTRTQTRMVEDLLDVSRIMTGQFRIEPRPVDLATVIAAAVDAVRPRSTPRASSSSPIWTPRGTGGRRPRSPPAGRLESPDERRQVHAARRAHRGHARAPRVPGRGARLGYRPRHRRRTSCPTSSSDSARRTPRRPAPSPASASAWRSSATWSSFTADVVDVGERRGGPGRDVHGPAARSRDAPGHPRRRRQLRRARAGAPTRSGLWRASPSWRWTTTPTPASFSGSRSSRRARR